MDSLSPWLPGLCGASVCYQGFTWDGGGVPAPYRRLDATSQRLSDLLSPTRCTPTPPSWATGWGRAGHSMPLRWLGPIRHEGREPRGQARPGAPGPPQRYLSQRFLSGSFVLQTHVKSSQLQPHGGHVERVRRVVFAERGGKTEAHLGKGRRAAPGAGARGPAGAELRTPQLQGGQCAWITPPTAVHALDFRQFAPEKLHENCRRNPVQNIYDQHAIPDPHFCFRRSQSRASGKQLLN